MIIMLGDKLCKTCKFSLRESVQIRSFSWFVFGHFSRSVCCQNSEHIHDELKRLYHSPEVHKKIALSRNKIS